MNSTELTHALTKLGMTQAGAALYFGMGARTVRRYASGELPVPVVLVLALTALLSGFEPNRLREMAGMGAVDYTRRSPAGRKSK